jgi:hypothetical protein
MTNARAALVTLLVLLGLVGLPTWVHLTSNVRPKAAQTGPLAPSLQPGPTQP